LLLWALLTSATPVEFTGIEAVELALYNCGGVLGDTELEAACFELFSGVEGPDPSDLSSVLG
jgi:hypothetical protein